MDLIYKQASTPAELQQILQLQERNLPEKLSEQERLSEGFVTVRHDLELLRKMNDVCGHVIAMDLDTLAGYALCMHPKFSNSIGVLKPMFQQIDQQLPGDNRYMVMGQVCIAKAYRARGIFKGLYRNMQRLLQQNYDSIITEVDTKNIRSVRAHEAVGFKELCRYSSGGQDWQLISLPTHL